jgi:protein involved in ribonucleotide reduction
MNTVKSLFLRLYDSVAQTLDLNFKWHKMPPPIGLAILAGLRNILRAKNLSSTYTVKSPYPQVTPSAEEGQRYLTTRTADGTYNDTDIPAMGSANTRFGRNVPLNYTYPGKDEDILTPNPRTISLELLARDTFKPVPFLNLFAAAWIQFMIHDWFSHGQNQKGNPWMVPLSDDDPWPEHPMSVLRTQHDLSRSSDADDLPPTFLNIVTHWWDGSQIYGSDTATQAKVRSHEDGKLNIGSDGLLPADPDSGVEITGVNGNWWIGLSLMHTLFTLEHNAICDRLRAEYPSWCDDDLFDHARLINVALMAKIHTVEWTPAILKHPTLQVGMQGNWWGLATEQVYKLFGRISKSEIISGIPGSEKNHFDVPYSLTEEFVSVYRMHPLLPDEFSFRSMKNDVVLREKTLAEVADRHARELLQQIPMVDVLYSFGTSHPGLITLHNYPNGLRQRKEPNGDLHDLATVEIIRDRERGVPRYNEFRKLVHRPPLKSFEELTDNKEWVEQLRRIYDNDINKLDLLVGLYAETPPEGFGFSDTAFRIFILMASRRLNSDRFFTMDYTPIVYTQTGLDWIIQNTMGTVLLRHFPALAPFLRGSKNAFAPWPKATS